MSELPDLGSIETSGTGADAGNDQAPEIGESGPAGVDQPLNSGEQALEHIGETAQTLEHDGREALETAGEAAGQAEADGNMLLEDVGSFADHLETRGGDALKAAGHIAGGLEGGGDRLLSAGVREVERLAEVGEAGPAAPAEQLLLGQLETETSGDASTESSGGTSGDGLTSLLAETGELGPAEVAFVAVRSDVADVQADGQSDAMATARAQADAVVASSRSFLSWAEASSERAAENLPQSEQSRDRGR